MKTNLMTKPKNIRDKKILNFTEKPNEITRAAIEEGRKIAVDKNVKSYKTMAELRAALEE